MQCTPPNFSSSGRLGSAGRNPLTVGDRESAIRELSLGPAVIRKLEQIAHDELEKN